MLGLTPPATALCRIVLAALLAGAFVAILAAPARACTGDCNGNGTVTVDELLHGVDIALGKLPLSGCAAFDTNGDGRVMIDELLSGVGGALGGCPPTPTPTATASATPSATPTITPTANQPP